MQKRCIRRFRNVAQIKFPIGACDGKKEGSWLFHARRSQVSRQILLTGQSCAETSIISISTLLVEYFDLMIPA